MDFEKTEMKRRKRTKNFEKQNPKYLPEDVDEALENPKDLAATAFLFVAEEEATARVVADF